MSSKHDPAYPLITPPGSNKEREGLSKKEWMTGHILPSAMTYAYGLSDKTLKDVFPNKTRDQIAASTAVNIVNIALEYLSEE